MFEFRYSLFLRASVFSVITSLWTTDYTEKAEGVSISPSTAARPFYLRPLRSFAAKISRPVDHL